MNKNILLLSTTIPLSCLDPIQSDLDKDLDQINVAFITTAANPYLEEGAEEMPEWVDEIYTDTQRYFGSVDMIDFTKEEVDVADLINKYDALFINGGNVFYLEAMIKQYNFQEVIESFINNKLYIGGSAGASVLGHDIYPLKYLDDINVVENASKKGLGLVEFNILPHYNTPKYQEKIKQAEKDFLKNSVDLLPIEDAQAVFTDGTEVLGYE